MHTGYILGDGSLLNELSENQKNNVYWTVVYVKKGVGLYLLDNSFVGLNEGDILILPPRIDYSFSSSDLGDEYNVNVSSVVLRFDKHWLDALVDVFPALSEMVLRIREMKKPLSVNGPKWIRLSSLLDEMQTCERQEQPMKVLSVLSQLSTDRDCTYIKDVRGCDTQTLAEKIAKTDRYLECNCCRKLTLEEISSYVGMSRTYFCQFFKTHYKEGFSDYLNRLRVEKAAAMLAHSDKSIQNISAECGFKTVQYFTRAFRKVLGITPGAFRRQS